MRAAQNRHVWCIGVVEGVGDRRRRVEWLADSAGANIAFLAAAVVRALGRGQGAHAIHVAGHEQVAAAGLVAVAARATCGHASPFSGRGRGCGGREKGRVQPGGKRFNTSIATNGLRFRVRKHTQGMVLESMAENGSEKSARPRQAGGRKPALST